jgi:hypothetical protein
VRLSVLITGEQDMIREFAFGLANRHHFMDSTNIDKWQNIAKDTYHSLWEYDEDVKEYVKKKSSLSGYTGKIYMPDEFLLDIDGNNPEVARKKTIALTVLLEDFGVDKYNIYFSGTGFHVGISGKNFVWEPCENLHLKVKDELTEKGIYEIADPSVTDKTRIIRCLNTRNGKSGLWKVQLMPQSLHGKIEDILEIAKTSCKFDDQLEDYDIMQPPFNVRERKIKSYDNMIVKDHGRNPDPTNYPCISEMLKGTSYGNRHAVALRLSAWLRWLYPEDSVRVLMETWRKKVDMPNKPFTEKELDSIINSAYEAHGGSGNRYGCKDQVMDNFCKSTCKLYKSKKSVGTMSAAAMEKELFDFYDTDNAGVNLGLPYNKHFPIYPGEVVIIQAPPKSMKTMLLQNWMYELKKPTYFLELEMSPRQIWSRFLSIHLEKEDEEIREMHKRGELSGISKQFDWLTVDYSPCNSKELAKKIQMCSVKPEVVIVDHMGLFSSNQSDNNTKLEEVSQSLMELAIQQNVIVFAVSEISKTAMREGMDISSSRGSFRVAYNANKIISVTPTKTADGLVAALKIETTANREKESLNLRLTPKGCKLVLPETSDFLTMNVRRTNG